MRKPPWIAVPFFVAVLLACILWALFRSDQPTYKGRSLQSWLLQHAEAAHAGDQRSLLEAEFAVREIGTNTFPTLLRWISKKETPLQKKVFAVVSDRLRRVIEREPSEYHSLTTYACGVLKSVAKPIVPQLAALLRDPEPSIRASAAFALAQIGPSALEAVPALLESLQDREAMANASEALKTIGVKPETIVTVLIRALSSTNLDEQMCAMWALARCGTNANAAVTNITPFLDAPDLGLRMSATNALLRITPKP